MLLCRSVYNATHCMYNIRHTYNIYIHAAFNITEMWIHSQQERRKKNCLHFIAIFVINVDVIVSLEIARSYAQKPGTRPEHKHCMPYSLAKRKSKKRTFHAHTTNVYVARIPYHRWPLSSSCICAPWVRYMLNSCIRFSSCYTLQWWWRSYHRTIARDSHI